MKRTIRKTVAVLLVMLMLVSVAGVSAFAKSAGAAKGKDYKTYKTYVSFGDSVAAGVSTSTYKAAHETKEAKKNYFVRASSTATAHATVQPTIGLLPIPMSPIISTHSESVNKRPF